jgi:hypothetical protein
VLGLLVLAGAVGGWNAWLRPANAASGSALPGAPSQMTFQQFLKAGYNRKSYHGPQTYRGSLPPGPTPKHSTNYANLLPSAEPPTMQPLTQALSAAYFQGGSTSAGPLTLVGSDGRLELLIQPGTFDVSHATVPGRAAPTSTLSLSVSELAGYFVGQSVSLGRYQLQLVDSSGQALSGVQVLLPITIRYHYQPTELAALGLDAGRITLTMPTLLTAARHAKTAASPFDLLMQSDPTSTILTAQSPALLGGPFDLEGEPQNQSSPTLHLAGVQGNSGQLTDSYPLQVPPGSGGFAPQLVLSYSSSGPNERHAATTPAGDEGDGWALSLGSISE